MYPYVASRIKYLDKLCKDSNTKHHFSSRPDGIIAEFEITNMIDETGKLAQNATAISVEEIIAYAMRVFIYDEISDTKEEEQE